MIRKRKSHRRRKFGLNERNYLFDEKEKNKIKFFLSSSNYLKTKLGSGTFKSAYKFNNNDVIAVEKEKRDKNYYKLLKNKIDNLHSLDDKIKKNLLIPEKIDTLEPFSTNYKQNIIMKMPLCEGGDLIQYIEDFIKQNTNDKEFKKD